MHSYAHSYYTSCSYVRVVLRPEEVHSSGWKLVCFNQSNVLLWEYIQLFYEKSTEWEIYTSVKFLLKDHLA